MIRCIACLVAAAVKSNSRLAAENLCLGHQLVVLKRHQARPRISDVDPRFRVLACRWFSNWRDTLIIVNLETAIRWRRIGWKAHWRRRSLRPGKAGRRPADQETRQLIRRLARENSLWGQRRTQAALARLGIRVCARTVAKYMRRRYGGTPSPGWWQFLTRTSFETWACDLSTVQTRWFHTLFIFFVVHHGNRQIARASLHIQRRTGWPSRR